MKKHLCILIAFLFVAAMAAGCSGKPKPTASAAVPTATVTYNPKDKIQATIALWDMAPAAEGTPSAEMQQYMEARFGVTLTPWPVTRANFKDKLLEAAAANALPDMFDFLAFDDRPFFKQLIDQKSIRDLPENIVGGNPNLSLALQRYRTSESVEGKLYFIPRTNMAYNYMSGQTKVLYYRADWGRESGKVKVGEIPQWKGFYELMSYYAHGDPDHNNLDDTYALTASAQGLDTVFFMTYGVRDWVLEGSKWVPGVFSNRAKEALKWANDACRNGLIDPNSLKQDEQAALEKFCSGKAGLVVLDGTPEGAARLAQEWAKQQPKTAVTKAVGILPQPFNPYGVAYNGDNSYESGTAFSAAVDDAKLKRLLPIFDWLYTKDGLMFAKYGKLGTDYEMKDGLPQTLRKDTNGAPAAFAQLNTQWAPVARISTWARDFIPEAGESSFEQSCLQAMQDNWWSNNWRTPLFTQYMFSDAVSSYDDSKAKGELARLMFQSEDIERDWAAYLASMPGAINAAQAQQEVNDYASQKGISKEE